MAKKITYDYSAPRFLETPDLSGEFHPVPKTIRAKKEPQGLKPGKRTKAWEQGRVDLKSTFSEHGITTCEVLIENVCVVNNYLGFAHVERRVNYNEEELVDPKKVVLACQPCHHFVDHELGKEESKALLESIVKSRSWE